MNLIAQPKFELAHFEAALKRFSQYVMGILPAINHNFE